MSYKTHFPNPKSNNMAEGMGDFNTNRVLQHRPLGTKVAKLAQKEEKIRDTGLHVQVEVTLTLAKATLQKADCMEKQNLLFFMTMPTSKSHPQPRDFLSCAGRRSSKNMKRGG